MYVVSIGSWFTQQRENESTSSTNVYKIRELIVGKMFSRYEMRTVTGLHHIINHEQIGRRIYFKSK